MPKGVYVRNKQVNKQVKQLKTDMRTISIKEACDVLLYITKDIKDFCISFDHKQSEVELLWHDDVYKVDVVEVPKVIDAIKYLQSKELVYVN
jgi:hypothetical protein